MNFGKGGQNIVQSGNNNPNVFKGAAGNILSAYLGTKMRRAERDYNRQADEESRIRVNKTQAMDKAGADIFKSMVQPAAGAHGAAEAYRIAMETHPEGHEKAGQFVNEEMANQVSRYGFDVGYRPAKTPASITQVAEWKRYRDENQKLDSKPSKDDYSGTVARFGKDGKITREPVSFEDIGTEETSSQRPPASMLNTDDSSRPSNQTWTEQQKADLEKERPRTSNLNTGINEGRQPSADNVSEAVSSGKVTLEEASDLSPTHNRIYKPIINDAPDSDTDINETHKRAGLNNNNQGTKY